VYQKPRAMVATLTAWRRFLNLLCEQSSRSETQYYRANCGTVI
jgi:hypothetical protein